MTETPLTLPKIGEGDRNLALINYALLFASLFFLGVPGLIAVIIAYSQRDAMTGILRRHYDGQIGIFWVAFVLGIVGTVAGVWAGLMGVGQLIHFSVDHLDAWEGFAYDDSEVRLDGGLIALILIALVSWLLMAAWLLLAPAIGFIRLATERRIGDGAA